MYKVIFIALLLFCGKAGHAQYFTTEYDTAYSTITNDANVYNLITNVSGNDFAISWHVSGHDFPADWSSASALAICDNALCRTNAGNQLLSGTVFNTAPYEPGIPGDFHLMLDLTNASVGTHYLSVNLTHDTQSKEVLFIINHWPLGLTTTYSTNPPLIYPNPATDQLTITGLQGMSRIVCINSYGQNILKQGVTGKDVTIHVSDWPAGIYSILYFDMQGHIAGSARFAH